MIFGHQLSLLWLLAWVALAFFGSSVVWLLISAAWQFSKRESEIINEELNLWNSTENDVQVAIPPKKETAWMQVGKALVLLAVILGAYDLGTKVNYSKEYSAWKAQRAEYLRLYAAWAARQPHQENK